jgi:Retinoblastoma-associated protein A domain
MYLLILPFWIPCLLNHFEQVDPTEAIAKRVEEMSEVFCAHYTAPSDTHPGSHETFAKKRLRMGEILYYKLLETILVTIL